MRRQYFRIVSIALLCVCVQACTANHELHHLESWEDIEALNNAAEGKTVDVILNDGRTLKATGFAARFDSIDWVTDSSHVQQHYTVAIQRVLRVDVAPISFTKRLTSGMLAGAALGFLGGAWIALDSAHPGVTFSGGLKLIGATTGIGFGAGLLYGALNGALSLAAGSQDRYYLLYSEREVDSILYRHGYRFSK